MEDMQMCKRFLTILLAVLILTAVISPAFSASALLFEKPELALSSQHALVINLNTGTEVYDLRADEQLYPASTTKIMTAILTLEACGDLEEKVEVTKTAMSHIDIYSSQAGLLAGESLSVRELLGLLMVKSARDAACVLAERVSGSEEAFAELMNQKASELGCTGTHFVNSTGMHDDDHYSTARDIAIITQYALKNPDFVEFFAMKQVETAATELSGKRFFSTTNYLIDANRGGKHYYKYATGGKTGTTTPAGRCLVSTAKKGEDEYLCLVFGADGDNSRNINKAFSDTAALYNWCFENIALKKVGASNGAQFETKLRYAWDHDYITLTVKNDAYAVMPSSADTELKYDDGTPGLTGLLVSVDIPDHLDAPVEAGDPAGTATYFYRDADGDTVLAKADIVVYESIDRNFFSFIFTNIGSFFSSTPMIIIIIVLIVGLVLFLIIRGITRSKSHRNYRYRGSKKYQSYTRNRRRY